MLEYPRPSGRYLEPSKGDVAPALWFIRAMALCGEGEDVARVMTRLISLAEGDLLV
jgi:hypothetical protein